MGVLVEHMSKRFGDVRAIDDVSLKVRRLAANAITYMGGPSFNV